MTKKRILIIDDDRDLAEALKSTLEETGEYEVHWETRGVQGCQMAKLFRPDFILLDILMPDMSGGEVARYLLDDQQTKDIPIAYLTAIVSRQELDDVGGAIGGYPFLAKPATFEEIKDCIEKAAGK